MLVVPSALSLSPRIELPFLMLMPMLSVRHARDPFRDHLDDFIVAVGLRDAGTTRDSGKEG